MAEVKLQVKVLREQVDKLQADIDRLNKTEIKIKATEATTAARELTKETEKAASNMTKLVREYNADGDLVKRTRDFKTGLHEVTQETEKLNEETGALERTKTKITERFKDATKAAEEHNNSVKKQGLLYDILGRSVSSFFLRMTAYRAVYGTIRAITNGFSEALDTLKRVDDELVTVRKVTGFSTAQMEQVEANAYSVATKYGANASDYVSGVAAFARAGYKELSGDLAELAQKTIIVGDTTAEIANQFLLSVDAAYKFKGSVSELSKVLDAANELDNKYATSIEKIAEGMGIVAPVAAQMHVGVYELEAAIGTITAVTQRSGTEAARALRAIMLNIVGDTKTEIEEGVTWTTGEIAGLKDVIKQFAPEAYKEAEAMGSIIDPMKAIGGLAESFEKGLLTEQKLMEMVSDIGGKLRTSQLLALIQNWDMYNSMLEDTANAAGSADKEISNAMDSWTRKANVLKNTFTEFVKSGLDSDLFKSLIDGLTHIIQRLGTLPETLARIVPFVAALSLHNLAKDLKDTSKEITGISKLLVNMGASAKGLNIAAGALTVLGTAWSVYSYIVEDAKRKHEEAVQAQYEAADTAQASAKSVLDLSVKMEDAKGSAQLLAEAEKTLADTLKTDIPESADEAIKKLRELSAEQLKIASSKAEEALYTAGKEYANAANENSHLDARNLTLFQVPNYTSAIAEAIRNLYANDAYYEKRTVRGGSYYQGGEFETTVAERKQFDVEAASAYRAEVENIVNLMRDYAAETDDASVYENGFYKELSAYLAETSDKYTELEKRRDAAFDAQAMEIFQRTITDTSVKSQEELDGLISGFEGMGDISDEVRERLIELAHEYFNFDETLIKATDATEKESDALRKNQKALDDTATATEWATAAKQDAAAAVHRFINALVDENGELTANAAAAFTASSYLADLAQAELDARNEAANANYAALRAELASISDAALRAAGSILAMEAAYANGEVPGIDMHLYRNYTRVSGAERAAEIMRQINALENEISNLSVARTSVTKYTSSYKAGSSSSSGKSSGGSSGRTSGGSSGKSSGSSSSASTEDVKLTAIRDKISLLKSELALMKERGDSEEKQLAKMREIQNALHDEAAYLRSINGDQITINDLSREWWSYQNEIKEAAEATQAATEATAEAIRAAYEAQIALNNAMNDRSVRYYNAETGQWEYGANQQNVENAREALEKAIAEAGMTPESWALQYSLWRATKVNSRFTSALDGNFGSRGWDFPALSGSAVSNVFGTNNYGNTYNLGGVSLTEAQAKGMSVYDLAMLSRQLSAHNSNY